jgi:hypothetical protein
MVALPAYGRWGHTGEYLESENKKSTQKHNKKEYKAANNQIIELLTVSF